MTVGVWLVGARGSVATTVAIGAAAIRSALVPAQGCVTELPGFPGTLPRIADLVFGGHDITDISLRKRAERLSESGVVPAALPAQLGRDLDAADAEIRPGGVPVARIVEDLVEFRERHDLSRIVVINVSSTEPPAVPRPEFGDLALLEAAGADILPSSSRYAYAAFRAGCGYVEFTPSPGPTLPALMELAARESVPYAGRDGKTGETLVKSALAPMFAGRALRVRSWSGPEPARRRGRGHPGRPGRPREQGDLQGPRRPAPYSVRRSRDGRTSTTSPTSASGRPPGTT